MPPRKPLLLVLVALPFVLRLVLVWQDFERLVKSSPLLEDDFFFYLNTARHAVGGHWFTADGETPTTGFQFLHQVLCTVLTAPWGTESTLPFRLVLSVQVLLSALGALLLFFLLRSLWSTAAGWMGLFLYSWWLPLIRFGNNGMETPLVIVAVAGLCTRFVLLLGAPNARAALWLGVTCAGSVLVRVDLAAVGAGMTAALMWLAVRGRLSRPEAARGAAAAAIGTTGALLALGALNIAINGHPLPDSGEAVRQLAGLYGPTFGGPVGTWASLLGEAGAVFGDHPVAQLVLLNTLPPVVPALLAAIVMAGSLIVVLRIPAGRRERIEGLLVTGAVAGGTLLAFYASVVPAYWFFSRYLFPLSILLCIFVVPAGLWMVGVIRPAGGKTVLLAVSAAALLYGGGFMQRWSHLMFAPVAGAATASFDAPLSSLAVCHNYDIALWVRASVREDERVAMWQGGLVAYMAGRRVLHLDGVVNRDALEAWTGGRLDRYLRRKRIDWFIDFRNVASIALSRCSDVSALVPAGASACSARVQVVAYRVRGSSIEGSLHHGPDPPFSQQRTPPAYHQGARPRATTADRHTLD